MDEPCCYLNGCRRHPKSASGKDGNEKESVCCMLRVRPVLGRCSGPGPPFCEACRAIP